MTAIASRESSPRKRIRKLQLPHVDSLLLRPVALSPTARSDLTSASDLVRRSPARKARPAAIVVAEETDAEQESDYNASTVDSDEDSICSVASFSFETDRPTKAMTSKRPAQRRLLFSRPRVPLEVVDLTSPVRNTDTSASARFLQADSDSPSGSSDADSQAILIFSPPRMKKPSIKDAQPQSRTRTPSPPPSPSKARLTSPSKKLNRIPPTPHRPSIDAFWNPAVVNAWNDEYSPRKTLKSPIKAHPTEASSDDNAGDDIVFTPTTSPRKQSPQKRSPTKRDRTKVAAKKAFERQKHVIADSFIAEMEEKISEGRIRELTEAMGGIKIIWSKKLKSTAGRANWKREASKTRTEDGQMIINYKHIASIELAEKVIDDEHRLLNVLAHEYCHLLNFMVSNVRDQPHGASFKRWASIITSTFADRGVEVTTKHSYVIDYKYAWTCENDECATEYQRHSKSIDPSRHTCGKCRGRLQQSRPAPRGTGKSADDGGEKKQSDYQKFVKDHFSVIKKELDESRGGEKSPMKDVMKEIGLRYRSRPQISSARSAQPGRSTSLASEIITIEDDDLREYVQPSADHDPLDAVSRKLDFLTIQEPSS